MLRIGDNTDPEYYMFVGWTDKIEKFKNYANSSIKYTKEEGAEIVEKLVKDAEDFREGELKYQDGFGAYELQLLENTASSLLPIANKYFTKNYLILFGRYLGGVYVFRKRKYGEETNI